MDEGQVEWLAKNTSLYLPHCGGLPGQPVWPTTLPPFGKGHRWYLFLCHLPTVCPYMETQCLLWVCHADSALSSSYVNASQKQKEKVAVL